MLTSPGMGKNQMLQHATSVEQCPDGLEFYFKGRTPGLTGFFNKTGENLLDYQVYMINGKGSKAVSARNRRTLTTQLPYNPIISYKRIKS